MIGPVLPPSPTRAPAGPLTGGSRLARFGGLGLASYALAVGGHIVAGGGWPGWPVSIMLVALLGVLGVAFTTRRRGLPSVLALLAGTQAGLHLLFSVLEAPASCALSTGGHHAMPAGCSSSPAGLAPAMLLPSLPMLAAHVAATVATAWVLACGEAWLWRVVRRALAIPSLGILSEAPRPVVAVGPTLGARVRRGGPDAPRGPPAAAHLAI
jgi:hypothetical protein